MYCDVVSRQQLKRCSVELVMVFTCSTISMDFCLPPHFLFNCCQEALVASSDPAGSLKPRLSVRPVLCLYCMLPSKLKAAVSLSRFFCFFCVFFCIFLFFMVTSRGESPTPPRLLQSCCGAVKLHANRCLLAGWDQDGDGSQWKMLPPLLLCSVLFLQRAAPYYSVLSWIFFFFPSV